LLTAIVERTDVSVAVIECRFSQQFDSPLNKMSTASFLLRQASVVDKPLLLLTWRLLSLEDLDIFDG
jgi:hypothetical protein